MRGLEPSCPQRLEMHRARLDQRLDRAEHTCAPAAVRRCVFEANVPSSPNTRAPAWPIDTPSFASRPAISA